MVINITILFFLGIYTLLIWILCFGWQKLPTNNIHNNKNTTIISIIIPVRNEQENIGKLLECINNQTYSKSLFEVIVVNDQSTDGTLAILNQFSKKSNFSLKILNLETFDPSFSAKKMAITKAISISLGQLIVCTDGDCSMNQNWLESIATYYETTGKKIISGPVTFYVDGLFSNLQIVEFASLIGVGAASIALNRPNMCNGANLAYEKKVFYDVGGFEGFEKIHSGDDEFLMHKIAMQFPGMVGFLKTKDAIVYTSAKKSLNEFFQQRKRWASKWDKYLNISNSILAIYVFLVNLLTIYCFILIFFGTSSHLIYSIILIKILSEIVLIGLVLTFFGYRKNILFIPIVQLFYPFYVIFIALNSYSKTFKWKGREY